MSVLVNKSTRVICQGVTSSNGAAWAALLCVALAAPAFAQDERPPYQLLEGIEACLMGAGAVDATSEILTAAGWTVEPQSEMGTVDFLPGVGADTFAFMSDTGEFCHVESMVMGTNEAAGMLELFLAENGLTVTATGTSDFLGCPTQTLSNGITVEITSAGNDPVCTADTTSGLRFDYPTGG